MPTIIINVAGRDTPLRDDGTGNPGTSSVGHMWYELIDGNGNVISYGFAPTEHGDPFGPGTVYPDDNTNYETRDYVKLIEITQAQYDALKAFGDDPSSAGFDLTYNGLNNSCIDFVWKALETGGLNPTGFQGDVWPTWNIDDVSALLSASLELTAELQGTSLAAFQATQTVGPAILNGTTNTIYGDLKPSQDYTLSPWRNFGYVCDEWGNIIPDGDSPNRADYIYDTTANDLILAGGGDDTVSKIQGGGGDVIYLGDGNDAFINGTSATAGVVVYGGTGNDTLDGGAGNDILYGGEGKAANDFEWRVRA